MEKTALLKVTLIEDENGKLTGYSIESQLNENEIEKTTKEETEIIERIRDAYFWESVEYNGRESYNNSDTTRKLKFKKIIK